MKKQTSQAHMFRIWALLPLLLLTLGAGHAFAAASAGYTKYFIPGDEDNIQRIFAQFGNTDTTAHSVITVTAWSDNTTIYYDHWENGYGFDPDHPGATADEIVVLANKGDFRNFESVAIPLPRTTATFYDGRDFIYVAGGTTTVTRASWLEPTSTTQSVAWEVYPLKPQLTTYILPFGEDLSVGSKNYIDFSRVFALIQATADGTAVTVDLNGDGTPDNLDQNRDGTCDSSPEINLDAGDVFLLEDATLCTGTLDKGTVIQATDTIQVQYVIGSSVHNNYEIRGLSAFPRGFWDNEYYAPVDGGVAGDTDIYLYNPHTTALTINYQTSDSVVGGGTFTIAPGDTLSFFDGVLQDTGTGQYVPNGSGVYFEGSDVFWGISSVDTESRSYDWGYSLVPAFMLSNEHFMGWAPAFYDDGTAWVDPSPEDDSGIFITPAQDNTTIFIDYDSDGTLDQTYLLNRLATQYVFDPIDGDLSGANIWGTGPYTIAYGQNLDTAPAGKPAIDVGYTTIPGVDFVDLVLAINKTADPVVVDTAIGSQSTFTLALDSFDFSVDSGSISITDTLPVGWEYVSGSTSITLADLSTSTTDPSITGSAAAGWILTWPSTTLGDMAENQQIIVTFTGQTTQVFATGAITRNQVEATGTRSVGGVTQTFTTSDTAFNTYGSLDVSKTSSGVDPLYPGDQFTYTVDVTNPATATADLTGIAIYDPLPAGIGYIASSSVTSYPITGYFNDTFSDGTYSNNVDNMPSGSLWTTDWYDSQDNSPNRGDIRIVSDLGSNRLRIRDDRRRAMRKADLSSGTSAILSFDARMVNMLANQYIAVEVCDSIASGRNDETCGGSGWVEITRFTGPGNEAAYSNYSYNLSTFLSNPNSTNFAVRLNSPSGQGMGNSNLVYFDNIKIDYSSTVITSAGDPPNFVQSSDGYSLAPGQTLTLTYDVTIDDPLAAGITSITNVASVNSNEITLPSYAEVTNIVVNPSIDMATVGELIWLDSNGDGIKDVGEPGLSGVEVTLRDEFGTPVATTTTDGQGHYLFTGVPAGSDYYVEVTAGLPAGVSQSAPAGHSDNRSDSFDLIGGQSYTGANLGYTPDPGGATFGNLVWSDADGDGVADAGEPGLAGIDVALYLDDGDGIFNPAVDTLVSSTTTAPDGSYLFTGIIPSGSLDYFVYVDSTQAALSGFTATTGTSQLNYDVAGGDVLINNDFGFQPSAGSGYSIKDMVWYDADGDGTLDAGESGIAGVTVNLLDASSNIIATTTTDSNGDYNFSGVPAGGNYTVQVTDTAGLLNNYYGTTAAALAGEVAYNNLSADVDNATTGTSTPSFGYNITSTIGDTVFHDLDGDGIQDAGEPGFSSVVVELQDGTCTSGTDCPTLTTDSNGTYLFTGVADGTYTVYVDPSQSALSGYDLTTPAGSPNPSRSVTVSGGSTDLSIDYGYEIPAATRLDFNGTVWDDADNDGLMDAGESGLENVTLEILDSSGNVTQSATTDVNGEYAFHGLPGGAHTYTIRVTDENGVLIGYTQTWEVGVPAGDTCSSGTHTCNDSAENVDSSNHQVNFGYYKPVPTLAVISSFSGFIDNGQTVIQWQTASESGTVGFYLDRLNPQTGVFERITRQLLPGLLHSPAGGIYQYIDENAVPGQTSTYKLIEVETRGGTRSYGPYTVMPLPDSRTADVDNAGRTVMTAHTLNNQRRPAYSRYPHQPAALNVHRTTAITRSSLQRTSRRGRDQFKLAVKENNIYCLKTAELASISEMSEKRFKRLIRRHRLSLSSSDYEVPWLPMENNTGICFYGTGIDSVYTDTNIYWLNRGKGSVMTELDGGLPAPVDNQSFTETLHVEENNWPLTALFDDPESDYWLWDYIVSGNATLGSKDFTLHANGVAVTPGTATLQVSLQGATDTTVDPDHHARIMINGTQIGESTWNGTESEVMEFSFDQALLLEGDNTVTVTGLLDSGAPYSIFYVNSFDLSYGRDYAAVADKLVFTVEEHEVISVDGFSVPEISVFDISDPDNPILVTGVSVDTSANGNRASFQPVFGHRYIAAAGGAMMTPDLEMVDFPTLKRSRNKADYLLITPAEFSEQAQVLADYRESRGYTTMVVELDDIYNSFNHGLSGPAGIHNFLAYAYERWRQPPHYVVLVGEGTYDYKDLQGYGDNLLPPQMVSTPHGLFLSDNALADVAGSDGLPEMAIGRLPVATADELSALITKIKTYEAGGGDWINRVLMSADNPDQAGPFSADSDAVAALLPSSYLAEKIYLANLTTAEARALLLNNINNGALLLNYIGHGGMDRLADEGLLLTSDVAALANQDRLPVLTAMTCVSGRFGVPGYDSITEALLLHANGGTIASWSPTGLSENSEAVTLDKELFKAVFGEDQKILGDAVMQAMEGYNLQGGRRDILEIYNLLGDPLLRLW